MEGGFITGVERYLSKQGNYKFTALQDVYHVLPCCVHQCATVYIPMLSQANESKNYFTNFRHVGQMCDCYNLWYW